MKKSEIFYENSRLFISNLVDPSLRGIALKLSDSKEFRKLSFLTENNSVSDFPAVLPQEHLRKV